ncbi:hypothetical protein G4G27_09150 [Sphingomonas sp. So64.6b]|uniref:hypothetical protein n=1 Tax=Sphingomonas sp. So64.6b TaxID=2997354 RepID=UPI0015FEE3DC|nr:hypothetical protein [Sphingomonas sp. So64.6b]QNA84134.1 hypothetical protein G4G27_09150 [Sphingomonas sp. So64.6b]
MNDRDSRPDSPPSNDNDSGEDRRSDIEQIVEARKDAVERGEGGREPDSFASPGSPDGVGGTGGVTKNQEDDAQ